MTTRPRIGVTIELDDSMLPQIDVRLREIIEPAGGLAIYLPRSPDPDAWVDVIAQKLRQAGFPISTRSVERVVEKYGLPKKTLPIPPRL